MPLGGDGQPEGVLYSAGQTWRVCAVRSEWMHPEPATAQPAAEVYRWVLLVEGPPLYTWGEVGYREVVIRGFAGRDAGWWMDEN